MTVLLAASLTALARGNIRLHGRINYVFFALTLIALLGPVSGAHFNPAVSLAQALRGALRWRDAGAYTVIQILGCCAGAISCRGNTAGE